MIAGGVAASFIALGATFIGTVLLLLFNPASRDIRWYAVFNVCVMLWLGVQGWALSRGMSPSSLPAFRFAVHMLPALFLATVVGGRQAAGRSWMPVAAVVLGLALFPVLERSDWSIARLYHLAGWCSGAAAYAWRAVKGRGRSRRGTGSTTRSERALELVLSGLVPIGVTGAIFAQGAFVLIILPVLTVMVLLLIFTGVVNHRFYDIEVRAARTGELAAAAAEHDRLALLGEISATIAHEVRNPLTGIRSLTQMIAEPVVDDAKRVRYAGVILDEVTRLDRIVGNLTDLARRSSTTRSTAETDLVTLFEDLRLLVDARARRGQVNVSIETAVRTVHAPREALAQALLNLLLNAIAHAPVASTVTLQSTLRGAGVTISVSDEGVGVPDAERERIFEPFQTRGGTGLGLAVVRRLAEEHGWSVAVANSDGGGAVFSLHIPQVQRA